MGKALYRTYRSRKLSEIVGQEHITDTLSHAIKNGTISHAYLFTGPKGVGKTSVARILAHEINNIPYEDDSMHMDIIEIDAASNRRVDEIRDLREKVSVTPTSAKYKIYIIDEVHMLTKEAFNALLKTLEEPPAHVIFILATTESYKLPETIISRTQRFTFRPGEISKVREHLSYIAKKEHISITEDALKLIAQHSDGSFRDSVSLLDQARNREEKVTLQDVQTMLGIAPAELIDNLVTAVQKQDLMAIVENLQSIHNQGYEPTQIAKQLSQQIRFNILENDPSLAKATAIALLEKLVMVPASPDPGTTLEIDLIGAALQGGPVTEAKANSPVAIVSKKSTHINPASLKKKPSPGETPPKKVVTQSNQFDESLWQAILDSVKGHHNTLYGVIRVCQPEFEEDKLTMVFDHAFHKKKLEQSENLKIVGDAIFELTGIQVTIKSELAKSRVSSPKTGDEAVETTNTSDNTLSSISNIFGSAELLES